MYRVIRLRREYAEPVGDSGRPDAGKDGAVHGQWQKQASFQCLASPCAAFLLYFHQICIKFVYLCPRPQYWGMSHKPGLC